MNAAVYNRIKNDVQSRWKIRRCGFGKPQEFCFFEEQMTDNNKIIE